MGAASAVLKGRLQQFLNRRGFSFEGARLQPRRKITLESGLQPLRAF